ncbi:hypothetical protein BCR34DRAFT_564530, partial [Clohesyomyces aquaticus]
MAWPNTESGTLEHFSPWPELTCTHFTTPPPPSRIHLHTPLFSPASRRLFTTTALCLYDKSSRHSNFSVLPAPQGIPQQS